MLKVTGIAYLAQFGMQLCIDAGQSSIASKIELAGKIMIMIISAPVLISLFRCSYGISIGGTQMKNGCVVYNIVFCCIFSVAVKAQQTTEEYTQENINTTNRKIAFL